jgi:hypothetical protein
MEEERVEEGWREKEGRTEKEGEIACIIIVKRQKKRQKVM